MKVPFTTQQISSCYEPKSVLDIRRSPSPAAAIQPPSHDLPQLDHHASNHVEDWDSLMKELGLHDDSTPCASLPLVTYSDPQLSVFPELRPASHSFDPAQFITSEFSFPDVPLHHNFNSDSNHNWNVGYDLVDELIRVAEYIETNSVQRAQVILARLNQRLRNPIGRPLHRAVFYFKEALQSLLTGSNRPIRQSSSSEIVQAIKAFKNFSNISPIPMFSSFTANQAILEAVDGSVLVHVIDFDIGLGGQWASFMKEISDKAGSWRARPPILRITAVVPEEYAVESRLIRENLFQFARELNIGFDIDFVLVRTFDYLSFESIKFMEGEKIAVLLSPTIFRRVGAGFVNDLRRVSPHVIVHVDSEGLATGGTTSFRQTVIEGLEFYTTLLESLEAAESVGGDLLRRIETCLLLPRIFAAVEAAGCGWTHGRETLLAAAGMRAVGLSQFANSQAECLLKRLQVKGFHVANRQGEMVLCWHEKPLVATSAWKC